MILKETADFSAAEIQHNRAEVSYTNLSQRFKCGSNDFSRQFSHIYAARLNATRLKLLQCVKIKWGDVTVRTITELAEEGRGKSVVIGTLCKYQPLKPSVLKELSEEHQLVPQPPATHYTSSEDNLVLEDETQRVRLIGNLPVNKLVNGIVLAVLGYESDNGKFEVDDVCFASPSPPPQPLEPLASDCYVALVSGIDLATNSDLLAAQMLSDWLCGVSGSDREVDLAAQVVQLIIAGGLVGHGKEADDTATIVEGTKLLDRLCMQLTKSIPVDIMPGECDPTNHSLPQQPILSCVVKQSSRMRSFRTVSNPYECSIGGRRFLGTGGQNVENLLKVTDDLDALELLKSTLQWGHLAPTAPDTLSCFPFYDKDPFVINDQPDVYFAGNQPSFQTALVETTQERPSRVVCVPRFSKTRIMVLVNLRTLDCSPVVFHHPAC